MTDKPPKPFMRLPPKVDEAAKAKAAAEEKRRKSQGDAIERAFRRGQP